MGRRRVADLEKIRETLDFDPTMDFAEIEKIILKAAGIVHLGLNGVAWSALFAILAVFGKRISEAVEIRTNSIQLSPEYLRIPFKVRKKKGRKPRRIKRITRKHPFVKNYIVPHILEAKARGDVYLFPRPQTKMGFIYPKYAWDVLEKLGLDQPVWLHLFRSSLATTMANHTGDPYALKNWFDWENINTADEYVKQSGSNLPKSLTDRTW